MKNKKKRKKKKTQKLKKKNKITMKQLTPTFLNR